MDGHCSLIVVSRRECLRRLRRDRGVLLDELRRDATERLDTERQRRYVEQQHILHFTGEHATLNRGAYGNRLIRVHVLAGLLAEQVLHILLHERHASLATNEDDLGDVAGRNARVLERGTARSDGLLHQVVHQGLELRPREFDVEMLRARRVRRDIRQIDVRLLSRRQLDLRLLRSLLEALHGERVLADVNARLFQELVAQEVDDTEVEILTTQKGVAVRREHFELPLTVYFGNLDDRDVEGATTQVVHRDLAVAALLVLTVGQRGRGGLIDDALHFEARDASGVLGRLALGIVEVGGNGNDGLGDGLTQVVLGGLLHFHEDPRRDLLRGHFLALHVDPGITVIGFRDLVRDHLYVPLHDLVLELASDEALDGEQGVMRIRYSLPLGGLADQHLVILGERDDRGGGPIALTVLDHTGLTALHDGHARIRRAEVNADYLCHRVVSANNLFSI